MGHLLWEVLERTRTGPIMKEDEFENTYFPTILKKLVQDYKIKWEPGEPIMSDPQMADAIFEGSIQLLVQCGLYCKDTKHIVKFSENELREVAKTRKHEVEWGSGRDILRMHIRGPEDKQHPYCLNAGGWMGSDIQQWRDAVYLTAREPTTDGMMTAIMEASFGQKSTYATPTESLAVHAECELMTAGTRAAGRPGMLLGFPETGTSMVALMQAFDPGYYTPKNCMMPVHILQDMRVVIDRLNLAYFAMQHGIVPWQSTSPTLYAYISCPEEAVLEGMAHSLGQMAYADGSFTQAMSNTLDNRYEGTDVFWCNSAMALAAERNTRNPWISSGLGAVGQFATETNYLATAAACITSCISGMEGMWMVGGMPALDIRFGSEVTRAAAGMKVSEGIKVIKDLIKKYEPTIVPMGGQPPPKDLYEFYDKETLRPNKWYIDHYNKMTKEFKDMGFDYPTWG